MNGLPQPKILYIQPKSDPGDERVISFEEVAELISAKDDFLSQRFAQSLRDWGRNEAGKV